MTQPLPSRISTRARRAFVACAMAGSLAVGLTACGSSGSSAAASAGATSTSSSSSRYAARLAFVKCMRSHGVNLPDPSASGGFGGGGGGAGGGGVRQALGTASGQAALKACASLQSGAFGFANLTPAQRAQRQQDLVKFAACMRAHNINMPDPTSNNGGGFGLFRSIPTGQRNSPAFQSAVTACSSNLPNGGRFGGGGPGAGSVGGPGA